MIDRHGKRFLARTFTDDEIAYCLSRKLPTQHFAARFAAKEATFKAFGTGWRQGLGWKEVEVRASQLGQPHIHLSGRAAVMARDMGITDMLVSLSHCNCHAIAQIVASGPATR